jgi:hypothetical protein
MSDCESAPASFDAEKYVGLLHDLNLTEAHKKEVLHALWLAMTSFVDLTFSAGTVSAHLERKLFSPPSSTER